MQRVLVLGGTGMLGHQLCRYFSTLQNYIVATTVRCKQEDLPNKNFYKETTIYTINDPLMDNYKSLEKVIVQYQPDVIINAIGMVNKSTVTKGVFYAINSDLPHKLYQLCKNHLKRFYLITISTDGVFSGNNGPYSESAIPDTKDVYGKTKLAGELTHNNTLTLRTSIYGRELSGKNSLLEWFLSSEGEIKGFSNSFFSGISTLHLCAIIDEIIGLPVRPEGIYHIPAERISKYKLLLLFKKYFETKQLITPIKTTKIDRTLVTVKHLGLPTKSQEEMVRDLAIINTNYQDLS